MNYSIFMLPALLVFTSGAYASCGNNKTIFFCNTENGKQIEVCDAKKTINYLFGRAQKKPELAINVVRDEASTYQWVGVGQTEYYSVDIPNGNTIYHVFWGSDRSAEPENLAAGVEVIIDKLTVATVYCKAGGLVNNMLGVDLKPS